ncbi:unnamed protein product, partial [Protopolystoma xenopodis]
SFTILRTNLPTRQRDKSSQSLDNRSAENGYTLTPLSVPAYLYTLYPLIPQLVTCLQSTRQNVYPFVAPSHSLSTPTPLFRSADLTRALQSGSPHAPVDRFLLFLVDRVHSVPVPEGVSLEALFLNALEARTPPPSSQSRAPKL